MRRLLPGMAALGALVITAPAQASFAPEGSPLAVGAAQPYGVADRRLQPRRAHRRGDRQRHREQPLGLPARPQRLRDRGRARRSPTGPGPGYGVAADFNGDGFPDVATQNFNDGTVSVLLRQPGGGFAAGPTLSVGGAPARSPPRTSTATGAPDIAAPSYNGNSNILTYLQQRHTASRRRGPQPHRRHAARRRGRRLQRRRSPGPGHLQPRRRLGDRAPAPARATAASPRRPRRSRSAPRPRASRRPTSTATVCPTSPWPCSGRTRSTCCCATRAAASRPRRRSRSAPARSAWPPPTSTPTGVPTSR